jgi:hypothetical protein
MLVYPGVALADALTLTGDRATRHGILNRAVGVTGREPTTEWERHNIDVALIRRLLGLTHPDLCSRSGSFTRCSATVCPRNSA